MSFVHVIVVAPDHHEFTAEISEQIEYLELLDALVGEARLPLKKGHQPKDDYVLSLVGALRLTKNAIIQISERNSDIAIRYSHLLSQ